MCANGQSTEHDNVTMASVDAEGDAFSFSTETSDDIASGAARAGRTFLESMLEANERNGNPVPEDMIHALAWAVSESAATNGLAHQYVQGLIEDGTDEEEAVNSILSGDGIGEQVQNATRVVARGGIEVVSLTCKTWLDETVSRVREGGGDQLDELGAVENDVEALAPQIVAALYNIQTVRFESPTVMYMTKPQAPTVAKDTKEAMGPYFDYLTEAARRGSGKANKLREELDAYIDRLSDEKFDATLLSKEPNGGEQGEVEPILATIERETSFQNHSLGMKALSGLEAIARGEKEFPLTPKSGKSPEHYVLTAAQVDCENLFSLKGANAEIVRSIIQTVYDLRTSRAAEGFVSGGRIWFTTGTILKELLRTTGGTIKEPGNSKAALKVVDAALMAASGARVRGVGPDGKVMNVDYFLNAVRRDSVKSKGVVYHDVWGFLYDGSAANTLNDYAMKIGQAHRYPLLDSPRPLEFGESWIYGYLLDMLNEANSRLYPNGAKSPKNRTCTIKRSWQTIFEKASPVKSLDSRKKRKIVEQFEWVLNRVAEMAKNGELRGKKPLYIRAKSEREKGRGRGAGAWKNLVIECHVDTVRPTVDLIS